MRNWSVIALVQNLVLFFGPTGMFFIPFPFVGSFRLFYGFATILILVSIFKLPAYSSLRLGLLFMLFIIIYVSGFYGMVSAPALAAYSPSTIGLAGNALIRVAVIGVLMFSFFLMASNFSRQRSVQHVINQIYISYWGFVAVFLLGSVLYLGAVSGIIPAYLYSHSVSLEQRGYGYLRLSPGTYPNEFGVLCSFYAIIALMRFGSGVGKYNLVFAMVFVAGMFLTSTRAAYVTFAVAYLTLAAIYPNWRARVKYLLALVIGAPVVIYSLTLFSFNVIGVLKVGYSSAISDQGSLGARTSGWQLALSNFQDHFWLGSGFGSADTRFLHNIPLQLLTGLGVLGLVLIIIGLFLFGYIQKNNPSFVVFSEKNYDKKYLSLMRIVLIEHVFLFGLTNHNQAHFLTWLLFALLCLKIRNWNDKGVVSINGELRISRYA